MSLIEMDGSSQVEEILEPTQGRFLPSPTDSPPPRSFFPLPLKKSSLLLSNQCHQKMEHFLDDQHPASTCLDFMDDGAFPGFLQMEF